MNRLLIRISPAAGSLHTAITETPPTTARAGGGRGAAEEGCSAREAFEEKLGVVQTEKKKEKERDGGLVAWQQQSAWHVQIIIIINKKSQICFNEHKSL